jgi:hypothetical protein
MNWFAILPRIAIRMSKGLTNCKSLQILGKEELVRSSATLCIVADRLTATCPAAQREEQRRTGISPVAQHRYFE